MLKFRFATKEDADLLYHWANDDEARLNSYNPSSIDYETHLKWFENRVNNEQFLFYIFFDENEASVGQVRIDKMEEDRNAIISISVDKNYRKNGYGTQMLISSSDHFLSENKGLEIIAYIFKQNIASYKSFIKAGFELQKEELIKHIPSYILNKKWNGIS